MESREVKAEPLLPRIYVLGFPKAGTHLALLLVAALAKPKENKNNPQAEWFGTFRNNSFSEEWRDIDEATMVIKAQPPGTWTRGHSGYTPELEAAFNEVGTCVVFIYRDLRDVAVSITYHIEDETKRFAHNERELYMALPDHDARLMAVIQGLGRDPGLIRRWELYAPWLDAPGVLALRYEDILEDREAAVYSVLDYTIKRTAEHNGYVPMIIKTQYDKMANQALYYMDRPKEYSPTFRRGVSGGWRDEFKPEHIAAFKEAGGEDWCVRLGYEESEDVRCVELV